MDLPQEISVVIGGQTYRLSKFTIPLYQEFLAWAKGQLPDPFDGIAERLKGLPDHLAKYMIDKAEERAARRGTLGDPDTEALAQSPAGLRKMVSLLFRKHQPALTDDQVEALLERAVAEKGEKFLADCFPAESRDVPAKPSKRR